MNSLDPLPLIHSWPLFEATTRIDIARLGRAIAASAIDGEIADIADADDSRPIGVWCCELRDNRLIWSPTVHALFGIPRGEVLTRGLAVSCYGTHSRTAMEQLRAHAIRHQRGFTLDAMIRQPDGDRRWMRLCALPVVVGGKVVRLVGTKLDVTADYDGPDWLDV